MSPEARAVRTGPQGQQIAVKQNGRLVVRRSQAQWGVLERLVQVQGKLTRVIGVGHEHSKHNSQHCYQSKRQGKIFITGVTSTRWTTKLLFV